MDEQLTFEFEQRPTIKGFPELRWTGKRPYRSTQYYPAQLRESYGEEQNGWINKIFWGDNLQVMSHLLKESPEKQIVIRMQNWQLQMRYLVQKMKQTSKHGLQICQHNKGRIRIDEK